MKSKTPQHILELSSVEQKKFIDSFDLVLSDCDGVLWLVVSPIENTGPALRLLQDAGKPCKFVSNNFKRYEDFTKQFKSIGIEGVKAEDIVNPPKTMLKYLKKFKPGEKVFSLSSVMANELLRANGIDVETVEQRPHWTFAATVEEVTVRHKVGAVLFDANFDLSYVELTKGCQYLLDKDCLLLVGGNDKRFPMNKNLTISGFTHILEHLVDFSKKQPIFVGKPSPVMGEMLIEMFQIKDPKRCLFIGDNLVQDIQFGNSCGFQTLLVLTGVATKEAMLEANDGPSSPNYYANSIADFIELFANLKKHNLS